MQLSGVMVLDGSKVKENILIEELSRKQSELSGGT